MAASGLDEYDAISMGTNTVIDKIREAIEILHEYRGAPAI
jgi:hypothetical protein